jgi:hypothetical protein
MAVLESFLLSDVRKTAAPTKGENVDETTMARVVEGAVPAALNKFAAETLSSIYKIMFVLLGVYLVYQYGSEVLKFLLALVYMIGHTVGIW